MDNAPEKKAAPIIYSPPAQEGKQAAGLTLWANDTTKENAPQMTGYLEANGTKTPVSAWIKSSAENGSFVSLAGRGVKNDDGSYQNVQIGKANAVNTENKEPLAADRTPYLLVNAKVGNDDVVVRGYVSKSAVSYMKDLGFNDGVIANFEAKIAAGDEAKPKAPRP